MRKWEGFGWCSGEITRVNDDARRSIAGDKVNFFAHYEIDGDDEDDVPHVLELAEYRMTDDAEYDSWLLVAARTPRGGRTIRTRVRGRQASRRAARRRLHSPQAKKKIDVTDVLFHVSLA